MKGDCATSQAVYTGGSSGQYDLDSFAAAIVDAVHPQRSIRMYYQSNIRAWSRRIHGLLLHQHHDLYHKIEGNWVRVPEPRGANKLQTDDPYPQILDGITESIGSAGPMEAGEEE